MNFENVKLGMGFFEDMTFYLKLSGLETCKGCEAEGMCMCVHVCVYRRAC